MNGKQLIDKWEHGCGFDWSVRQRRDELALMIDELLEDANTRLKLAEGERDGLKVIVNESFQTIKRLNDRVDTLKCGFDEE